MWRALPLLLLPLACSEPPRQEEQEPARAAAPAAPTAPAAAAPVLAPEQAALLDSWFAAVAGRRPNERFGELVSRTGLVQLGVRYQDPPDRVGPEDLEIELATFECVTFVESTLAVARCSWSGEANNACFLRELEASRYRGGQRRGFASRLHYFVEWIDDNARRSRLRSLTAELGGRPSEFPHFFMSGNPQRYPALAEPTVLAEVTAIEARLSASRPVVLERSSVGSAERQLEDGDIVAFVGSKPGLMITHAGFVERGQDGVPRVLHASSYHGRVLLTSGSLASYVQRRPERLGVLVARPEPP